MSQVSPNESDSEKIDKNPEITLDHLESEIIDSEIAVHLEKARSRPDIIQAESEFLQENLSKLGLLEQIIERIESAAAINLNAETLRLDFSEDEKNEILNEAVEHILVSEWYVRLTEVQARLSQIDNGLELTNQSLSSKKELNQILDELEIPYSKALLSLLPRRSSYAMKMRGLVDAKSSSLHAEKYQLEKEYHQLKSRCEDTHAKIPALYRQTEFPDYRDFPDFESYEKAVRIIVSEFKQQLHDAAINPINILRENNTEYLNRDTIRQAASRAIDSAIRMAFISEIKRNMANAGVYSAHIARELIADGKLLAKSIFNETSLAAYYTYCNGNIEITKRLNHITAQLNNLADDHSINTQHERVDILRQLEESAKGFGEFVDSSTDLYWHATPVVDLIIEAGELSPRVDIDIEKRVTNTGEHSKGIHFSREGFDYLDYSLQRPKSDIARDRRGLNKYTATNGPYAIVVPLGGIVEHAPYRIGEVASKLPSNPNNPYRRQFRDSDVVFWGAEDEKKAFDYDLPLDECFVVARESQRSSLTSQLNQAGYTAEWIGQHLILFPDEFMMEDTKLEQIGTSGLVRFPDGRMGKLSMNEDREVVMLDEKTNRTMRLASVNDRIESYVSRRIKKQLTRSLVVPLRAKKSEVELEHTDTFRQAKGYQTHRQRPIRRHVQSSGFDEIIEQMTVV